MPAAAPSFPCFSSTTALHFHPLDALPFDVTNRPLLRGGCCVLPLEPFGPEAYPSTQSEL
eukprot:65525-Chlamydomonas_euryale.AAC.2